MEAPQTINGLIFAQLLRAGAANLSRNAQTINELNVFPIPDGDTGDNMLSTVLGGTAATVLDDESLGAVTRRIADGMLLSARGNSGVILSQIFEGIANGFEGTEEADGKLILKALQEGVCQAYNAVMEPTEGTILTVMRCATEYVSTKAADAPIDMMREFLDEAKRTLEKTPDMLSVLKKAGVVDSGGAGLVYMVEGMLQAAQGEAEPAVQLPHDTSSYGNEPDISLFTEDSILEYGYCTELLLRLQTGKTDVEAFDTAVLTERLGEIGDSVVAFKTGSIVKLHIHTMTPDRVLAACREYGEFLKVKIENMSLQHNNTYIKPRNTERKPYGVVAVASGDGIKRMFEERGADAIVDGGKSMNPSAEDIIEAIDAVNADTVFILPNNGNVILAAKQAAGMYKTSDVRVIESRTIGDGCAALSMMSFESGDTEKITEEMTYAMQGVVTAEVSRCIRDTDEACAGDYVGIVGKNIITDKKTRLEAACTTFDAITKNEFDVCIIIRGKDVDEAEAKELEGYAAAHCSGREVCLVDGEQEIYDYILIFE